jgi:hypothetical protein
MLRKSCGLKANTEVASNHSSVISWLWKLSTLISSKDSAQRNPFSLLPLSPDERPGLR